MKLVQTYTHSLLDIQNAHIKELGREQKHCFEPINCTPAESNTTYSGLSHQLFERKKSYNHINISF